MIPVKQTRALTTSRSCRHASHMLVVFLSLLALWAAYVGVLGAIEHVRLASAERLETAWWFWYVLFGCLALQVGGPVAYVLAARWRSRLTPICRTLRRAIVLSLFFAIPVVFFAMSLSAASYLLGVVQ